MTHTTVVTKKSVALTRDLPVDYSQALIDVEFTRPLLHGRDLLVEDNRPED
ncbi:hypothetical protein ACSSVY_001976 [Roseovarius sp. MBR-51]